LQSKLVDVLCLNETKISKLIPDDAFRIDGYQFIRRDREENEGGGVAVYIKNDYKVITMDKNHVTENITLVLLINKRKFNFIVTYRPPYDHNSELLLNTLTEILHKCNLNNFSFIIGDLNYDFLSDKCFPLKNLLDSFSFTNTTSFPTRFSI
jgi:exonuclease III